MNLTANIVSSMKGIPLTFLYALNLIAIVSCGIMISLVPLINALEDDELSHSLALTAAGRLQIVQHSVIDIFVFSSVVALLCFGMNRLFGIEDAKYFGQASLRKTAFFVWINFMVLGLIGCVGFLHQLLPFGIPAS